ncbi:unnamed protein product [Gadus morhua 'NCC']
MSTAALVLPRAGEKFKWGRFMLLFRKGSGLRVAGEPASSRFATYQSPASCTPTDKPTRTPRHLSAEGRAAKPAGATPLTEFGGVSLLLLTPVRL